MKCGLQNWIKKVFIAVLLLSVANEARGNSTEGILPCLRIKQIMIPGYPHAFNPGIIRWQGKMLLNFRVILDPRNTFTSMIGLIWLDEDFNPIGEPSFLNFREDFDAPCRADDPRFIVVKDKLYLVYSDNIESKVTRGGFRVHIAELVHQDDEWHLRNVNRLIDFEGNDPKRREKNWSPFVYQNQLHLVYSISPHTIFLPQNSRCEVIAKTTPKIEWKWGELRGGTPAVETEEGYLSFFHCSKLMQSDYSFGKEMPHYFMGAYLFANEPPFGIKKMSQKPIIEPEFYEGAYYKPYWRESRIVFPSGLLVEGDIVTVSYGREDHECWVMQIEKNRLLESLSLVR